jgi:hypothetical protein
MKLVILTGPSGCGKSQMLKRAMRYAGVHSMDTGDLFKAQLALSKTQSMSIPGPLTGEDAFTHFIENNLDFGVSLYESMKRLGEIAGAEIIYWIETLRATCPDLPSRSVATYAKIKQPEVMITAAINVRELGYLRHHFLENRLVDIGDIYAVYLDCENPVKRTTGDNRNPVPESRCVLKYWYRLEESSDVLDKILEDIEPQKEQRFSLFAKDFYSFGD